MAMIENCTNSFTFFPRFFCWNFFHVFLRIEALQHHTYEFSQALLLKQGRGNATKASRIAVAMEDPEVRNQHEKVAKSRGVGILPNSQGSLNYPFWGDQTMQIYDKFEGFPLNSALFGLVL